MTRLNLNILLAAAGLLTAIWHQASRADDLLELVDGNAAACLHVRDLTGSMKTLEDSAFADRLRDSTLYEQWLASPEYKQVLGTGAVVSSVFGRPVRETVETLFGREFVIAMSLTTGTEPTGVLLVRADSATIETVLTGWNRLEKQDRTQREFQDRPYFRAVRSGSQSGAEAFYVILDDVFALSNDESQIHRVIELSAADEARGSLARNADFEPATWRRKDHEVFSVFVNPRAFDSLLQAEGDVPPYLRDAWKRCRWLSFRSLIEKDRLQFQLIADYDSSGAPDWWDRWIRMQAEHKLPLAQVPSSALLTMSGHVATDTIRDLVKSLAGDEDSLPNDVKQVRRVLAGLLLGADPLDDLLPMLGPRWLTYAVPSEPAESAAVPVDGLIAIELQLKGTAAQKAQTKAGLENALTSGLNALAAVHNAKTSGELSVLKQRAGVDTTIHWAEPVTVFRPAFAVTDRYLVLATAPEVCSAFVAKEAQAASREESPRAERDEGSFADNNQLIVASSVAARKLLKTHSDWFIRQAERDNLSEEEATQRLAQLQDALSLLDRAWFSVSGDAHTLTATIGASVEGE